MSLGRRVFPSEYSELRVAGGKLGNAFEIHIALYHGVKSESEMARPGYMRHLRKEQN